MQFSLLDVADNLRQFWLNHGGALDALFSEEHRRLPAKPTIAVFDLADEAARCWARHLAPSIDLPPAPSENRAPGVRRATVNFATNKATVEYDPKQTGVRPLLDVVRDVGYEPSEPARVDFVVDDSARPSGSTQPLENHLSRFPAL
jgi:hypothetical protein